MKKWLISGVVLGSLWGATPSGAQLAVYDAVNHQANIFTGFQSFISATKAVIHTANWIEDLAGFESSALAGYQDALEELTALLAEGQTFWNGEALRPVLGLEGAVDNSTEFAARMEEQRLVQQTRYWYALRAQGLTTRTASVVNRLIRILERVLPARGDKQILQNLNESVQQLNQVQTQQSALVAAYQAATITEPMAHHWIEQSMILINQNLLVDWVR